MSETSDELIGKVVGRWTVLERRPNRGNKPMYLCRCACGTEKAVYKQNLIGNGISESCGCLMAEKAAARTLTHGLSSTPEYRTWVAIKTRCYNPKHGSYGDYGGRGIRMAPEWETDPVKFITDVGPRPSPKHSIERLNVNANYEPGNVVWATKREQSLNTRRTIDVEYKGITKLLKVWAEELSLDYNTMFTRIKQLGWTPQRAFETPIKTQNNPAMTRQRK